MWKFDEHESDWNNVKNYIESQNYEIKTDMDNLVAMVISFWELDCIDREEISLEDFLDNLPWSYGLKELDYYC